MSNIQTFALFFAFAVLLPCLSLQAQETNGVADGGVFVSEGTLDTYTGTYLIAPGSEIRFWRDNEELMVQETGQEAWPMRAESETVFMVRALQVKVTFETNAAGETDHVVLLMDGRETKAMRRR